MTVPANFKTAISSNALSLRRWLEIAGIPICYGNFKDASGTWFAARAAADQFDEVRPHFKTGEVPANFDGELDPLDAIAKAMGQVEFSIVDVDGIPTKWAGNANKTDWVYLAADITATATVFNVTPSVNPGVIVGDYLYIGAETMKVTGVANGAGTNDQLTVLRGRFRSKAKAFGAGFPLAKHPYTMKGRRAWYYQTAAVTGSAHAEVDKALRFAGTVETFRLGSTPNEGPGFYVLGIQSLEKLLSREVFRDLRTFQDDQQFGLSSPPWTDQGLRPANAPGGSSTSLDLRTNDYKKFTDFEVICARIDDEFVGIQRNGTKLNLAWRGLFNTDQSTHRPGFTGKEIAWIAAYDSQSQYIEHGNTRFTSVPTTGSPLPATHPLIVILQVMLSTGDGTNNAGGGGPRNYDVLPKTWGLGIDYTRVDIAGIEKLAGDFPSLRACGVIEESVNFVEFARKLLQPFGFYALTTVGDLWTIRYLRPPLPDETTRALDNSKRISKQTTGWDSNLAGVVQEVAFKYGWDPTRRIWRFTVIETFDDARLYADEDGRRLAYELPLYYPTGAKLRGMPPIGGMPNLEQLLKDRGDFYRQRYARPPAVINETVDYSFLDLEVGDLVSSNHNWLPNPGTGLRKLIGSLQQAIKKAIDDRSKTVKLTLLDSGYNAGDYRFISPALHLSLDDSQDFWVYANDYTEPTVNGLSQNDMQVRDSNGTLVNTFTVGQKVRIWLPDFSNSEHHVISGFAPANVGNVGVGGDAFSTVSPVTLAGFDFIVTYEDYDTDLNIAGIEKLYYAWMADSALHLGAADNRAHTYFP